MIIRMIPVLMLISILFIPITSAQDALKIYIIKTGDDLELEKPTLEDGPIVNSGSGYIGSIENSEEIINWTIFGFSDIIHFDNFEDGYAVSGGVWEKDTASVFLMLPFDQEATSIKIYDLEWNELSSIELKQPVAEPKKTPESEENNYFTLYLLLAGTVVAIFILLYVRRR